MTEIAFIDLKAQQDRLGSSLNEAIDRVLEHGKYIMGPEVSKLETELSDFCQARHALTCSNGTDALTLPLMAWGIGPGDAVLVPSFTFIATAEAPAFLGATPIFLDVLPDTFNLDPAAIEPAVEEAKRSGLTPRAIIPVDLFGQPANYPEIRKAAVQHDLKIISDAAQSFGARLGNASVGTMGDVTTTSFFPAKPLGCYGDGGAVFTDDDALMDTLQSIRVHGKGREKYDNVRIGQNARLDTIQAAVVLEKLKIFPDELESRNRIATIYSNELRDVVKTPTLLEGATSSWAQFTILTDRREAIQNACKEAGIPTQIYYHTPMHLQTGYRDYPTVQGGCPVSESLSQRALSLPMHPYLDDASIAKITATIRRACRQAA